MSLTISRERFKDHHRIIIQDIHSLNEISLDLFHSYVMRFLNDVSISQYKSTLGRMKFNMPDEIKWEITDLEIDIVFVILQKILAKNLIRYQVALTH